MAGTLNALETALAAALADPLAALPAGTRAIGCVGADLPLELLRTTGRPVVHLPWWTDRPTPVADRWLERSFPGWARSQVEDWAAGRFDGFGDVVFTRGEDGAQRLYYYLCELQRRGAIGGPRPLIFDIGYIPRASSARHTAAALRRLAASLAADPAALATEIEHLNRRRVLFGALQHARGARGSLYERIARASLWADLDAELSAVLEAGALPHGTCAGRVLLAGSAPPDDRLHVAVERAGWTVAGEAHERSLTQLGPPLEYAGDDPVAALAAHLRARVNSPRCFVDRAAWLLEAARTVCADAVILWLVREEEALGWQVPAQRRALAGAGLPALLLTDRRWDAADGAPDEIETFLGGLHP